MRRLLLPILLLIVLLMPSWSAGQPVPADVDSATSPTARRLFRIGYLEQGSGAPSTVQMEALRDYLMSRDEVTGGLLREDYEGIGLFASDSHEDMRRRLGAGEFDLAFAPAWLFVLNRDAYTAILQEKRPDDFQPTGGGSVLRQGAVIISPRNPLFSEFRGEDGKPPASLVREVLGGQALSVVSTQSIAGFYAPLLDLARDYQVAPGSGRGYIWFDSSEEVVKAVLSGLAGAGACERPAIDRVLSQAGIAGQRDQLLREILATNPFPTDPVVLRRQLSPAQSPLGRALRNAMQEFSRDGGFSDVRFVPSRDAYYDSVPGLMRAFDREVGEIRR